MAYTPPNWATGSWAGGVWATNSWGIPPVVAPVRTAAGGPTGGKRKKPVWKIQGVHSLRDLNAALADYRKNGPRQEIEAIAEPIVAKPLVVADEDEGELIALVAALIEADEL